MKLNRRVTKNFYLRLPLVDLLSIEAARRNTTQTEIVSEALLQYFERQKDVSDDFLTILKIALESSATSMKHERAVNVEEYRIEAQKREALRESQPLDDSSYGAS